ncbi:hypothetical protein ACRQ1B_07965 [Rhizobium panacihumi]
MTSASFFFWYVLPLIIAAIGWGAALYSRYSERKTRPDRHAAE